MLIVQRGTRVNVLAAGLAGVLTDLMGDAFVEQLVAVPAKGVERWLAQRLAHVLGAADGDGVCANVLFPSPVRMLDETAQAVSPEHALSVERWAPARRDLAAA